MIEQEACRQAETSQCEDSARVHVTFSRRAHGPLELRGVLSHRAEKASTGSLSTAASAGQNVRPFSEEPMSERRAHPHFDDHGTLSWHTRYKDALAGAQRDKKTVFIELGREL
jgi:hypothetical protein